ncbi:MAG: C39 family peptidase [Verrucomicrobiales bacterium]|nr:C39 family peptidase [Verrucomicrobiales bacterium]
MLAKLPTPYPLALHASLALTLLILLVSPSISQAELGESRTFTNIQGVKIKARLKAVDQGKATITLENGRDYTVAVASFSPTDQSYIKQWTSKNPNTMTPAPVKSGLPLAKINDLLGHELFIDGDLWQNPTEQVAARLQWPRESKTPYSSSYRAYPRKDYRFASARPYSAVLYGGEGKVNGISIVFANKGDFFGAAGSGEDHFIKGKAVPDTPEGLNKIMDRDAEAISTSLTKILGPAKRQKFGDGKNRQTVLRWDWSGHAFLLGNAENEYVSLSIQPVEFADKRGKSKRVPDSLIRKRARGNVEKRDNGDVVINNIPMVDQGPKGYCVPATAERCMRYLGIPADMYLLAMAGQTGLGGGTSPTLLLDAVGKDIKRKGRSFKIWDGEIKLRELARYIDDGIPVMWTLFSTKPFNEIANTRTKERQDLEMWSSYKKKVLQEASTAQLRKERDTAHIVIIIGYNKDTNEIAFSDSWGERYMERWISIPEAQQVSQGRFYVVDL